MEIQMEQEINAVELSLISLLRQAREYGSIREYMETRDLGEISVIQDSIYLGVIRLSDILFTSSGKHDYIEQLLYAPVIVAGAMERELCYGLSEVDEYTILDECRILDISVPYGRTAEYVIIQNHATSWIIFFNGRSFKLESFSTDGSGFGTVHNLAPGYAIVPGGLRKEMYNLALWEMEMRGDCYSGMFLKGEPVKAEVERSGAQDL